VAAPPLAFEAGFTVGEQIEARAKHPIAGPKTVLMQGDRRWTYAQFRDESVRMSHFLLRRLGRIDEETTANVGVVSGGTAANVVAERCVVQGEARSHDLGKVTAQVEHMVAAVTTEAAACGVDVEIDVREAFRGYRHEAGSPLLAIGAEAAARAGLSPRLAEGGGGSDGNVFNARGLPALTLGVGFEDAHSPQERMSLDRLAELYAIAAGVVHAAGTAA